MDNEKMKILKMLESGLISADEAARLLNAAAPASGSHTQNAHHTSFDDCNAPRSNNGAGAAATSPNAGLDDFAKDLGQKFDTLAKEWEPKLQKFVSQFAEKTVDMAGKFSQSISASAERTAAESPRPAAPAGSTEERNFELRVLSGYAELNLSGMNAPLTIKGYNGDTITLKATCKTRRFGGGMQLKQMGSKYTLLYDENDFLSVEINAFVPMNLFSFVTFTTANGPAVVSDFTCKNMHVETLNGPLTAHNLDVENLKLITANGPVNVSTNGFFSHTDYTWLIETSNSPLKANMPADSACGYHIKAFTSLGDVRLGLTNLNFLQNAKSNAEAKTIHFENMTKRVKMSLETSNGPIIVN